MSIEFFHNMRVEGVAMTLYSLNYLLTDLRTEVKDPGYWKCVECAEESLSILHLAITVMNELNRELALQEASNNKLVRRSNLRESGFEMENMNISILQE